MINSYIGILDRIGNFFLAEKQNKEIFVKKIRIFRIGENMSWARPLPRLFDNKSNDLALWWTWARSDALNEFGNSFSEKWKE